jgi:hypothetical protein
MIVGTGIDIAEVPRIRQSIARFGDRFLQRIYTAGEIRYCDSKANRAERYAARFAAKEAAMKALGTGWSQWRALAGLRSGAPAGRTSDHHFPRKSRRDCGPAGREACCGVALSYSRAGHRTSHSRKLNPFRLKATTKTRLFAALI